MIILFHPTVLMASLMCLKSNRRHFTICLFSFQQSNANLSNRSLLSIKNVTWQFLLSSVLIIHIAVFSHQIVFAKDSGSLAAEYNQKATLAIQSGNYLDAYTFAQKAIQQASEDEENIEYARALSNLASTQFYIGENDKALSNYLKSLKVARDGDNIEGIERAINNIKTFYLELKQFNEAYEYLLKLPVFNGIDRPPRPTIIANLARARLLFHLEKVSDSKAYLEKTRLLLIKNPIPFLQVYWYILDTDIKQFEDNYIDSFKSIDTAIKLSDDNGYSGLHIMLSTRKSKLLFDLGSLNEAEALALKSLAHAEKINLTAQQHQLLGLLSEIEKEKQNFERALIYFEKKQVLSNILEGEKVQLIGEITRIDRQIDETERKLVVSLQQQKIAELNLETQKQAQVILLIIVLGTITLIVFWYHKKASTQQLVRQRKLNQELKELDKLKDRILTNTSHELRTPLNGIIGLSQIILSEYQDNLDPEIQQSIKLIEKSGLQLSEIVNDILDLAQLRAQKMSFNYQSFDLTILINQVIALCKPLFKDTGVDIVFAPDQSQIAINQDKKRLQQILFNIIGNAIKFTTSGTIEINCKLANELISITIADTGIGIPQEKIERIFEGFEQVNPNDNRLNSGTGLGLAISKELTNALGGDIKIQSTLGEGTFVAILLPNAKI